LSKPPRPAGGPPAIAKAPFNAAQARTHQAAWAAYLGAKVEPANGLPMTFVLIPPGEFLMGSSDEQIAAAEKAGMLLQLDEATRNSFRVKERPQHLVKLTQPYLMGRTEVTVGQFRKFVAATNYVTQAEQYGTGNSWDKGPTGGVAGLSWHSPGQPVTDDSPVTQVTWNDAVAFCQWMSEVFKHAPAYQQDAKEGWVLIPGRRGYRLPTEAEWEFACRAGTTTQYSFGDDHTELPKYGWFATNAKGRPQAAGSLLPNPFGLCDMHGNVYEWCHDWSAKNPYEATAAVDPFGPASGVFRKLRGGSCKYHPLSCRSAGRNDGNPLHRYHINGFRLARTLSSTPETTSPTPAPAPIAATTRDTDTFNGHRYQFVLKPAMPWAEAKVQAERMGGYLAVITSREEDEWVRELLKPHLTNTNHHCWLGASCDVKRGAWRWVTGEPFSFTSWAGGEPSYHATPPWGLNYHRRPDTTFGWNDSSPREVVAADLTVGYLVEWDRTLTPYDILTAADWEWSPPENMGPAVNGESGEGGPCLSADGLSLLLESDRPGGHGSSDLYICRRAALDAIWQAAENLGPTINSPSTEGGASLSADGLTILFSTDRGPAGTPRRIWMATRKTIDGPWSPRERINEVAIAGAADNSPEMSADGLSLFFHSFPRPGGLGDVDIWESRRKSKIDAWDAPQNLAIVNSGKRELDPALSSDGRVLIFASNRDAGSTQIDLWWSSRPSPDSPWSAPVNLGLPNSSADDLAPALSNDGRTLIFRSHRAGGRGSSDLWLSRRVPKRL
jgi:formylglycine-generating enzyme required for sulfatase activity